MPYQNAEFDWLGMVIVPSLQAFYGGRDRELITRNVHERTIVSTISCYMRNFIEQTKNANPWIDNLSLDVEYNRNFTDSKRIYEKCQLCEESECSIKQIDNNQDINIRNSIPDILIHKRGSNEDNQVVIEFKTEPSGNEEIQHDYRKLSYFTCQYGEDIIRDYKFRIGFFILLGDPTYTIETFENGRRLHRFPR